MLILASSSWTLRPLLAQHPKTLARFYNGMNAPRILIITTATLAEGREVDKEKIAFWKQSPDTRIELCDLREATRNPLVTEDGLKAWDMVILLGGNTFALLESIQRVDALCKGGFSYTLGVMAKSQATAVIGESAGACVFGADIAHLADADDPSVVTSSLNTKGLNLLPYAIVPHIGCPFYGLGDASQSVLNWIVKQDPKDWKHSALCIHEAEAQIWFENLNGTSRRLWLENGLDGVTP